MNARTLRGIWWLVAIILPLFFLNFDSGPGRAWLAPLFDPGHIVYFCLVATAVSGSWERRRPPSFWAQLLVVIAIAAVIGGGIELLQKVLGGDAEFGDVRRDIEGAVTGLVFFSPRRFEPRRIGRWILRGLVLVALAAEIRPAASYFADRLIAIRQFPVLADFETPFEQARWSRGTVSREQARHGDRSLRVDLTTEHYSGTQTKSLIGNWSGYRSLHLSVYNDGSGPLTLTLKIFDEEHIARGQAYDDRYNRNFTLHPGWNDLDIPLADIAAAPRSRTMDLGRMYSLSLFATGLTAPRRIYLDDLYLAR